MPIELHWGIRTRVINTRLNFEKYMEDKLRNLPINYNRSLSIPPTLMTIIYRLKNSHNVLALVNQAVPIGVKPALWALDEIAPALAKYTLGCGPGSRSTLLSSLVEMSNTGEDYYILTCDDDVEFALGTMDDYIKIAVEAGFMVSMPTHCSNSYWSFFETTGRFYLLARTTGTVDIGPIVLIHPSFKNRVFPMNMGMGWGSETKWYMQLKPYEYNGMVDAVRIRHLSPVAVAYDISGERARHEAILAEAGLSNVTKILKTRKRTYRWQRNKSFA